MTVFLIKTHLWLKPIQNHSVIKAKWYSLTLVLVLISAFSFGSCSGNPDQKKDIERDSLFSSTSHNLQLKVPTPPTMLSDSAKLDFMAEHYWDNFNYADTAWIADTVALEHAFEGWAKILSRLPKERTDVLSGRLISNAEKTPAMLLCLSNMAERYFDDPNSPFRNESLYIPVLKAVLNSRSIDSIYKTRPRVRLALALKNSPGTKAADFVYTMENGTTKRLSDLTAEYTLLLFYVPDCPNCASVEQYIVSAEVFAPLVTSGRLKLLAIYPGKDFELWLKHLPEIPAEWIVGRDAQRVIDNQELYDIRVTPSLYLLDRNKHVILKDVPVHVVEKYIQDNIEVSSNTHS